MPHSIDPELGAKYAYWERAAPVASLTMALVVGASSFIQAPTWPFVIENGAAGMFVFLGWRLSLAGAPSWSLNSAVAAALISLLLAMAGADTLPFPLVYSQGLGLCLLSFSVCVMGARAFLKRRGENGA